MSNIFPANCFTHPILTTNSQSKTTFQNPPNKIEKQKKLSTRLQMSSSSQLAQLASMTTLSIDSGDLNIIRKFAETGFITDATTNPLFVSQAGLSGDPVYAKMVDDAVAYAVEKEGSGGDISNVVSLAIDKLAINLGAAIADIVPGYISTEVDPRYDFCH